MPSMLRCFTGLPLSLCRMLRPAVCKESVMPPKEDKHAIYERAQLGHALGFGKKPAVIVVDFQLGFTAPEQSPLAGNLDAEVKATNDLIAVARKKNVPIIFTVVGYDPHRQDDAGLWPEKAPSTTEVRH
ncbi:MAG TPA: isochorismatase family protein [Myxococcales bacterium]|nr:isochorismatase family protein [Myxococcales bacterium]